VEGAWKNDRVNSVNDTTNSNDIRLNDGRFVDHDTHSVKHDTDGSTGQGHKFYASGSDNISSSENAGNDVSRENSGKFSRAQSTDNTCNVPKGIIGGAKDG
jgi:hypothetical protein